MNTEQLKEKLHQKECDQDASVAPMKVLLAKDSEGNAFAEVGEVTLCRGTVMPDGSCELVPFSARLEPPVIVLWPKI